MEKTTVYLTSEQRAGLAAVARAQGRSEARLIRDGIDAVLERGREPSSPPRPRWLAREAFVGRVIPAQADAALLAELRELLPDTTDDDAR